MAGNTSLTAPTDSGGGRIFASDEREPVTRTNVAENELYPETRNALPCPRCGGELVSRFYGPCGACRAQLCATAQPIAGAALVAPGGRRAALRGGRPPAHAGELDAAAQALGASELWIMPEALDAWGLPRSLPRVHRGEPPAPHPWISDAADAGWTTNAKSGELRSWLTLWREGERARLDVVVPAWDRQSPLHDVADAAALLGALDRLQELVGVRWNRSGAITSDGLLRDLHRARAGLRLAPTELPERVELDDADYHWRRRPTEAGAWCHAFDLSAMYLGAASSLGLPEGEPRHVVAPDAIDPKVPALWRIAPPPTDEGWPDPFRPRELLGKRRGRHVWTTTPVAMLAQERGVTPDEGWVWPTHHQHLERWYRALRDARAELVDGRGSPVDELALALIKATYRQGIGRLGSDKRERADDPLRQPVWRSLVITTARARLTRRLRSIGTAPVAVDVDAVWWITDEPDPLVFAQRAGIPLGDGLGQFHVLGSLAGDEARRVLSGKEPDYRAVGALREATR